MLNYIILNDKICRLYRRGVVARIDRIASKRSALLAARGRLRELAEV